MTDEVDSMNDALSKLEALRRHDGWDFVLTSEGIPGGYVDPATVGLSEQNIVHAGQHAVVDLDAVVAELIATRPAINYCSARWLIENPNWDRIVLIGWRGRHYLVDGHHRTTVAALRGDSTIRARCYYGIASSH